MDVHIAAMYRFSLNNEGRPWYRMDTFFNNEKSFYVNYLLISYKPTCSSKNIYTSIERPKNIYHKVEGNLQPYQHIVVWKVLGNTPRCQFSAGLENVIFEKYRSPSPLVYRETILKNRNSSTEVRHFFLDAYIPWTFQTTLEI